MSLAIHPLVRPLTPLVNRLFLKKVEGLEQVPKTGPYILSCNHVSVPDEWLLGNLILQRDNRRLWFIGRDDFWFTKWRTRLMAKLLCVLLIDWRKPAAVLGKAQSVLKFGGIVATFPEGTRNFDATTLALGKTGLIRLALAARCPVIPVGYQGPGITKVVTGLKHLFKRNLASLRFGVPLDFSAYYNQPITRELLYELTDQVMIEIGRLCNKRPRLHEV